jgi:hypothetical protein
MDTNPAQLYFDSIQRDVRAATKMLGINKRVETVPIPVGENYGSSTLMRKYGPVGKTIETYHRIGIAPDYRPGDIAEETLHASDRDLGVNRAAFKGKIKNLEAWAHKGMEGRKSQMLSKTPKWVGEGGIFPYAGKAYTTPDIPQVKEAMLNRPYGSRRWGGEDMRDLKGFHGKLPVNTMMNVLPVLPGMLNYAVDPQERQRWKGLNTIQQMYEYGGVPMAKPEDYMT